MFKNTLKFYKFLVIVVLFSLNPLFAEDTNVDKTKVYLLDQKLLLTPPKKIEEMMNESLEKIESECCEVNFEKKDRIEEIKENFNDCLNKKCHKKLILFYVKKPQKLNVIHQVKEIEGLLIQNEKQKFTNMLASMEESSNKKINLKEKDIEKVKESLKKLNKENLKLKEQVEKMLKNYETRISKLEKENNNLKNENEKIFNMLPKHKQKKVQEELSE